MTPFPLGKAAGLVNTHEPATLAPPVESEKMLAGERPEWLEFF